jgi:hypothetical protein
MLRRTRPLGPQLSSPRPTRLKENSVTGLECIGVDFGERLPRRVGPVTRVLVAA